MKLFLTYDEKWHPINVVQLDFIFLCVSNVVKPEGYATIVIEFLEVCLFFSSKVTGILGREMINADNNLPLECVGPCICICCNGNS